MEQEKNIKATNGQQAEESLYQQIRHDDEIRAFLELADEHLGIIGYTEHGERHGGRVGKWAALILEELEYDKRTCELARISGFLHDIGNFICRENHGQTGANLLYPLLQRYDIPPRDLGIILSAVGNHEEQYGKVFNPVCAAVVIADKCDVHRSRVRSYDPAKNDIHDHVNYAVTKSRLHVDNRKAEITLELVIDTEIAGMMDYFRIFMERMVMTQNAANFLGCEFSIVCNGMKVS